MTQLTYRQKQTALDRHRAIILATFNYSIKRSAGSFVGDQLDPVKDYYVQQKIQTEEDYERSKLGRLQQRLVNLTKE